MGSVKRLAEEAQRRLSNALSKLRKIVVRKLALAVGAMLEKQTPIRWNWQICCHSLVSLFKRGLRRLMRCLQNDLPLPAFCEVMRN